MLFIALSIPVAVKAQGLVDVKIDSVQILVGEQTGYEQYIDTSYKPLRMAHNKYWREHSERVRQVFQRNSVDYVSVATNGNYVTALQQLFAMRA